MCANQVIDIDITALSDSDLLELMQEDLYDGFFEEVEAEVREALARKISAVAILNRGLLAGLDTVGEDFRDGFIFVPEVLMAVKAMNSGLAVLEPLLAQSDVPRIGKMVIGTVKGDIHDVGKNLVIMLLRGAGFEMIDLGVDVSASDFVAAVRQHKPDLLGMSALLTTTMPQMRIVMDALIREGLRDDLIVLVGGAPLNDLFAQEIGADEYCRDAACAVEAARMFMQTRKGVTL